MHMTALSISGRPRGVSHSSAPAAGWQLRGAEVSEIVQETVAEYDAPCWPRRTEWQATTQRLSLLKRLDSEA